MYEILFNFYNDSSNWITVFLAMRLNKIAQLYMQMRKSLFFRQNIPTSFEIMQCRHKIETIMKTRVLNVSLCCLHNLLINLIRLK